jgi:hypothetical protein
VSEPLLLKSTFRGQHIHYLNLDCEGRDLSVLKGLDFSRYSPDLITVEASTKTDQAELTAFLQCRGYQLSDVMRITLFFTLMGRKRCLVHDGFRDDHHQEPDCGFGADLPCFAVIKSAANGSSAVGKPVSR